MEGERGSGDGGTQARMISVQRGHLQTRHWVFIIILSRCKYKDSPFQLRAGHVQFYCIGSLLRTIIIE